MQPPTIRGNHPPSRILIELETRNVQSMAPNAAMIGMAMAGYKATPEIGPMSIWGVWFVIVPIGFWIYCRMNKIDKE